jgi:hypothetical protein
MSTTLPELSAPIVEDDGLPTPTWSNFKLNPLLPNSLGVYDLGIKTPFLNSPTVSIGDTARPSIK